MFQQSTWSQEDASPYIPFWPHPIYSHNPPTNNRPRWYNAYQQRRSYGPAPSAHRRYSRLAHYSQYSNPYSMGPRSVYQRGHVIKVPATYACQRRDLSAIEGCPIVHSRAMEPDFCLLVYILTAGSLHLTRNWLVSLMERYPGYRDLHLVYSYRGVSAVVSFDTNYHTRIAMLALDGFVTNSRAVLRVRCVHRAIYRHIYDAGFNPETYVLH